MNRQLIDEVAQAVSDLIDCLEAKGIGPELTQKIVIEATGAITSAVVYTTGGY